MNIIKQVVLHCDENCSNISQHLNIDPVTLVAIPCLETNTTAWYV